MNFLLTLVQVSRPGFFHVTAFPYLLVAFRDPYVLLTARGLAGLLFVLFPLNLLVYSFNDYKDVDIDRKNPRKGGLHGAQASASDLKLCIILSVVLLALSVPILTGDLMWSLKWVVSCILVNWSYNFGPQLSRVPLLDMFPPLGYMAVCLLSSKILDLANFDRYFYCYFGLMVFRTQLWLQRMDIVADAAVGKRTTAVFVGSSLAGLGVILLLLAEMNASNDRSCQAGVIYSAFSILVFGLEVIFRNKEVTMVLMGVGGIPFFFGFMSSSQCLV